MQKQNESEISVHKYTNYRRKLLLNSLLVLGLIGISCVIIFILIIPGIFGLIVAPVIDNMYSAQLDAQLQKYNDFLTDCVLDGKLINADMVLAKELIKNKVRPVLDPFYKSLKLMFNIVAGCSMLVLGTLLSFYIRSNADTFILGLGPMQKKMLIEGIKEDAEIEKAILDYFYVNTYLKNENDFAEMRFNSEEFKSKVDEEKLSNYLAAFGNKSLETRIKRFLKYINYA